MNLNDPFLTQILLPAAARFVFFIAIVGIAVGVGLALVSARMLALLDSMNRWVSTRRRFRWVEVPREVGHVAYEYRRWIGPLLVLCAGYSIFVLLGSIDSRRVVGAIGSTLPSGYVLWMVESAIWFLVLGSAATIVVGTMLVFFPSRLSTLEERLNRWYSTRRMAQGSDTLRTPLDSMAQAYPRTAGWTIAAISLFAAIESAAWLFARP